jgi:hypothetical protein
MADKKETPGAARLRREKEIEAKNLSGFGLSSRMTDNERASKSFIKQLLSGKNEKQLRAESDEYGTQMSSGAEAARDAEMEKQYRQGSTLGEAMMSPKRVQAGREAAAEERREARGMKKGGKVSSASNRADGCAIRGKTKGKMV